MPVEDSASIADDPVAAIGLDRGSALPALEEGERDVPHGRGSHRCRRGRSRRVTFEEGNGAKYRDLPDPMSQAG